MSAGGLYDVRPLKPEQTTFQNVQDFFGGDHIHAQDVVCSFGTYTPLKWAQSSFQNVRHPLKTQ